MLKSEPYLIGLITQRLVDAFQPEQIYLFGSRAWGASTPESDVDVLVIVAHSSERPTHRATQAYRALRGVQVPIDVLVKTRAEFEKFKDVPASLEYQILQRGKLIYDHSPSIVSD